MLEPDSLTLRALPSSGATHTRRCGPGLRPRPLIIIFPPTSAHEIASIADRSTGRAAEAVLLTLSSGGGAAEGRHPTQPDPANLCLLDAPPHFISKLLGRLRPNFASKPLEFGVFRAFYRAELVRCRVVESEPWLAAPVALTDLII